MGKRKKRRAAKRRGLAEEQRLRHRARARADLLYDPGTDPGVAAEIVHEVFGGGPVDVGLAETMASRIGMDGLRAVAGAALERAEDPAALSLASDVAILDHRPVEAEDLAGQALELLDDPALHLRLAAALASQGRVSDAMEVLDEQLRLDPGQEALQFARRTLLGLAAPDVVDRFLDRTPLEELQDAIGQYVGRAGDPAGAFAGGLQEWIEAGAVTEDELTAWTDRAAADIRSPEARLLRLIGEWVWVMPLLDDDLTPLEALAADEGAPEALRRRAEHWQNWALWGLWEVQPSRLRSPGTVLTDLVTGLAFPAEVPAEWLEGLPRWSVLVGYLVPVDGVWRAGSGFEVATPVEARFLVHDLLDHVLAQANEFGREGRPMVTWIRRVHDEQGPLWLPAAAEAPSQEAMAGLQLAVRAFVPHLVAGLRELQGRPAIEPVVRSFGLTLGDPDAAWRALAAAETEFEAAEEDGLVWLPPDGGEEEDDRAFVHRDEDGGIVVEAAPDDVPALLELLRGLGHPATAEERPADDEPPAPLALPDLPDADLGEWLQAWPDEPLDFFEGATPRDAGPPVAEMLIRYLEHDADRRGVELDTRALRTELGLETK